MDDANLALTLKLQDIANIAVGICVVHAMSFIYKCSNKEFSNKLRSDKTMLNFNWTISIAGLLTYLIIIWFCYIGYETLFLKTENADWLAKNEQFDYVWNWATWTRTTIVILFTSFAWLVLKSVLKSKQND